MGGVERWGLVVGNFRDCLWGIICMCVRLAASEKGGVPGGGGCSGFVPESVPGLSVVCKLWLTRPCS